MLERVVFARPAANGSAAPEHQRRDRHHRKDGEDAEGCGQLAGGEKAVHPSPLVHRRQDQREHGQHRPDLPVSHPRQADVQEHQVGEQRNRPVLSRRQQRRRREAAEQPEHCDEERFPAKREQHGDSRHRGEQREGHQRGNQIPQRVRGEKGREENRDGRGVERVGERGVPPRGLELADDEQRDGDGDAYQHAHRRLQPALLRRVPQEEDGRDHDRDAGDRREQLGADEALPVERRGRRFAARAGGDGGTSRRGGTGGATAGSAAAGGLEAVGIDTDGAGGVGSIVGVGGTGRGGAGGAGAVGGGAPTGGADGVSTSRVSAGRRGTGAGGGVSTDGAGAAGCGSGVAGLAVRCAS